MNTYVMGEIATLLVISVLAGILIGWCIKSLFAGRRERVVRTYVARDVDHAAADVESMRTRLERKEEELSAANHELQKMRGRDISMKAGNTSQVEEINKLKNELAIARQSLDRNRTEFNTYRNDSQKEVQTLNNKLARFTAGGPVYDERMTEAGETITALRTATRENDRVIDSLRARVKEGDNTVDNLRNQLKNQESSVTQIAQAQQSADDTIAGLNTTLKETASERDQLKRDYDITLANKNSEISKLQTRLEELGKSQTELKTKEHEIEKARRQIQENATRSGEQIAELKQNISNKEAERAAYLKDQKRMQQEIAALQAERNNLKTSSDQELQTIKSQFSKAQGELESVGALKKQVENKSAEVVALNDMLRNVSNKRNELQSQVNTLEAKQQAAGQLQREQHVSQNKVAELTATLHDRDATIAKLRSEFDEVVQRRNQLGIELGELQTQSEQTRTALQSESEQQLSQLVSTLKDRDQSFAKLRQDMDEMTVSRDRLTTELKKLQTRGVELENFKTDMQTAVANRDSELKQRSEAYQKLQSEFNNLSKIRDDYELRIEKLKTEVQQQSAKLKAQEENSRREVDALRPQITDLRTRLSLADSDNQKISSELADAAALKLALTEKESVIQKLQIDLQDAKLLGSGTDQASQAKIDGLTGALRERDEEIARLNTAMTDNRLGSKKSQSEITLLKQEVDSQSNLIKGLEEQAENTLVLHKKIAAQSTEIEELRARLYHSDDQTTADSDAKMLQSLRAQLNEKTAAHDALQQQILTAKKQPQSTGQQDVSDQLRGRITQLEGELKARHQDVEKLTAQSRDFAALKEQHQKLQSAYNTRQQQQRSSVTKQQAAAATDTVSADKPRVFVRPESTATTESITGVTAASSDQRATYTRDGYRIKHLDGRDNLALLPGISSRTELELNKHGVSEFEQIVLWGKREVLHFAERSGIAPSQAEGYNWPHLAGEILKGSFRRAEYLERDSNS